MCTQPEPGARSCSRGTTIVHTSHITHQPPNPPSRARTSLSAAVALLLAVGRGMTSSRDPVPAAATVAAWPGRSAVQLADSRVRFRRCAPGDAATSASRKAA